MRIYNATNSQISLPFPGGRLDIPAHSISGNVGANTEVISTLVSAYSAEEIAFVVSGPFELNLCSSIPTVPTYVVQSLEEALEKFHKSTKKEAIKTAAAAKVEIIEVPEEELDKDEEEFEEDMNEEECEVDDCGDDCECECEDEECECESEEEAEPEKELEPEKEAEPKEEEAKKDYHKLPNYNNKKKHRK